MFKWFIRNILLMVLFKDTFVNKEVTLNDIKMYPLSNNVCGMIRILAVASTEFFETNSFWVIGVNNSDWNVDVMFCFVTNGTKTK